MAMSGKEVRLVARPVGEPQPGDFAVVEAEVPALAPGQVLVRNDWMSVDPAMRSRMRGVRTYVDPFELGRTMDGPAVGRVIESAADGVEAGATVRHMLGWREYAVLDANGVEVLDVSRFAPSDHLGVLGLTGLTAYAGLTRIAPVRAGDVVFVSGAAGAVGLVAGAIARLLGASRVIGSTGGAEKAALLVERFGYDAALDYRAGDIAGQLAAAAPDGIHVYFDNVGGDHLQAAIGALRKNGQVAICGAISQYSATKAPTAPNNLTQTISKRLTLRGFLVFDHYDIYPEYLEKAAEWIGQGLLPNEQTVVEGIDEAPTAFIEMLRGANIGKMLVRLTKD